MPERSCLSGHRKAPPLASCVDHREIDIAGDQCTMPEAAAIFGQALGRRVEFVHTPIEEVRAASEDHARMLEWFDRVGYDVDMASLRREFGIELLTLRRWAERLGQA